LKNIVTGFWRLGMSTSAVEIHPLAQNVTFTDSDLVVDLIDGRRISVPLEWFPRLANASRVQLENFEILADGEGIHWSDVDEDLSVAGLLRGEH
jgi:hypothetical protein